MPKKKSQRPIFGVAKRIFNRQNAKGGVPSTVLASSRAVLAGSATQSDRDAIFDYYKSNISTGGSGGSPTFKQIARTAKTFGRFAESIVGGQWTGYQGNLTGAAQDMLGSFQSVTRDKLVGKFAGQIAETFGGSAKGALAGLQRAGAFAGGVSDTLGVIGKAGDIVGGAVRFGETMAGLGEPDYVRQARAIAALSRVTPGNNNEYGRGLADSQQQAAEIRANARWVPEKLQEGIIGFQQHEAGVDTLSLAKKQMFYDNFKNHTGSVSADSVFQQASNRVYQDKFGLVQGALRQKLDAKLAENGIYDAEMEAAVAAKGAAMKSRSDQLKEAGFKYIEQGNLTAGSEYLHQANNEVEGAATAWANPEGIYTAMLAGAAARRMWSFSNMPRRTRTGE